MPNRRALPWLALAVLLLSLSRLPRADAAPVDVAAPAGAAQATVIAPPSDSVRTTIDTALTEHLDKLLAWQIEYSGKGIYYQTLESHSTPPADGQLVVPDRLDDRPTDQAEKLDDFWQDAKLAPALPYSFRVDVYDGPFGQGYVLTASALLAGELWQRSINTGPETWRESAWHVVPAADDRIGR